MMHAVSSRICKACFPAPYISSPFLNPLMVELNAWWELQGVEFK